MSPDEPADEIPDPDETGAPPRPEGWGEDAPLAWSPYPDEAAAMVPAGGPPSPYPDGAGPGEYPPNRGAGGHPQAGHSQPGHPQPGFPPQPIPAAPYPPYAQYDPGDQFEPPEDLPPWYEDEYYDDRDWERLPRRTSTLFRVLAFCLVLFFVGLFAYRYVDNWWQEQLDPPGPPGQTLVIEIPQGATTNDIARILADEEIVANSTVFRYWLRFNGDDEGFQAGTYEFQVNSAVEDVKEILLAGPLAIPDDRVFITVPEGLTVDEMRDTLLAQLPLFDEQELSDAITAVRRPSVFSDAVLFNTEGIFFPETYDVDELGAADEIGLLNRMTAQFQIVATETGLAGAPDNVGLSPYQALIVASLIEEEAVTDADRPKIARVIYNRIAQDMRLDIDATVVYALGGDRELSATDLEFDSPYNTRLYPGLPPSPIASPGRLSIEAALNPEPGDWIFYVRTDEDGPGSHTFSTNIDDHNAAVQICIERDLGCG